MHIGYVPRESPIFSPEFPFRSISFFTNYQKKYRSGAYPINIFWRILPFRRPSFSKISLISNRSRPLTAGSARTQSVRQRRAGLTERPFRRFAFSHSKRIKLVPEPAFSRSKRLKLVPEPRIFKLKTAQARCGAPHFHARPGARSGALAHFSLCRGTHTYQNLG